MAKCMHFLWVVAFHICGSRTEESILWHVKCPCWHSKLQIGILPFPLYIPPVRYQSRGNGEHKERIFSPRERHVKQSLIFSQENFAVFYANWSRYLVCYICARFRNCEKGASREIEKFISPLGRCWISSKYFWNFLGTYPESARHSRIFLRLLNPCWR